MSQLPAPVRRTDAERNRDRILAAARAAFGEADADVSMAEVSRRAGVGMATLYRNFPGRQELLEALYSGEVDAICRAAATVDGAPGERLVAWLRLLFAFFSSKRPIAGELLKHTGRDDEVFGGNRARVLAAAGPLLLDGQRAGAIRDDLDVEQVLDMVHAIATIRGAAAHVAPILEATLDGLRVAGAADTDE